MGGNKSNGKRKRKLKSNRAIKQTNDKQQLERERRKVIVNQNHKSQTKEQQHQHKYWNVIKSCNKNVKKLCMLVTKSRNNDINAKGRQIEVSSQRQQQRQQQNQQTLSVCMPLDLLFNGILIFVSAMSQQGGRWKWMRKKNFNCLSHFSCYFLQVFTPFVAIYYR
jgi:hypothetical protein